MSINMNSKKLLPEIRRWTGLLLAPLLLLGAPARAAISSYTEGGYTLIVDNRDASFSGSVLNKMVETFFTVYPQLVSRFNAGARTSVTFVIDPGYGGVAYTSGGTVTYSAAWFHSHPQDTDVVTHEIMHVVQAYSGSNPGWLVEGIADFVRYKYGINNVNGGWSLPAYQSGQSYTDSYRVTARFLVWVELRVRETIADDLNAAARGGSYTSSTWVTLTGQTVDQLWSSYAQDPSFTATARYGSTFLLGHNPGNTYYPASVQAYVPKGVNIYGVTLTGLGHNQDCQQIPRVMKVTVNGLAYQVISWLSYEQTSAYSYTLPAGALVNGTNNISAYIDWGNAAYDCGHWGDVDVTLATKTVSAGGYGTTTIFSNERGNTADKAYARVNIPSGINLNNISISGWGHNDDTAGYARAMRVSINGNDFEVIGWLNDGQTLSFSKALSPGLFHAGTNDVYAYIHWSNDYYDSGHRVELKVTINP